MGSRGRKSGAALSLITRRIAGEAEGARPEPPESLTPDQAAEWRAIVARMPADWFPRETHAMLESYCDAAVTLRYYRGLRGRVIKAKRLDLDAVERVDKLIGRLVALQASLATKMRISQHASYDRKKSKGTALPRPWEE